MLIDSDWYDDCCSNKVPQGSLLSECTFNVFPVICWLHVWGNFSISSVTFDNNHDYYMVYLVSPLLHLCQLYQPLILHFLRLKASDWQLMQHSPQYINKILYFSTRHLIVIPKMQWTIILPIRSTKRKIIEKDVPFIHCIDWIIFFEKQITFLWITRFRCDWQSVPTLYYQSV